MELIILFLYFTSREDKKDKNNNIYTTNTHVHTLVWQMKWGGENFSTIKKRNAKAERVKYKITRTDFFRSSSFLNDLAASRSAVFMHGVYTVEWFLPWGFQMAKWN